MTHEILKVVGQVAGLAGVALGVLLIVFREFLRKTIFANLTREQSFRLLKLLLLLTWSIAIVGIVAWVWVSTRLNSASNNGQPQLAFDYSEVAGEYCAQLGSEFDTMDEAEALRKKCVSLVEALATINAPIDMGNYSYDVGVFFGRSDVCVEKSLEQQGKWIVVIDLIASSPDGEMETKAEKKLAAIRNRCIELFRHNGDELDAVPETKTLLSEISKLINSATLREYGIADYQRMYGRALRNTKLAQPK
jgi:flagellar basal body-associated protein FliL